MAFEELSALSGQDVRKVEFDMVTADLECFRQLRDYNDFNPSAEVLTMLKPMYRLKGVPRAWRKTFHQVLIQWMSCRQLCIEPEFYRVHNREEVTI